MLLSLVGILGVWLLVGNNTDGETDKSQSEGSITYGWQRARRGEASWQPVTCDEWGFEIRLTNRSSKVATFKVWAEVFDDQRRQVDRDSEIVSDLEPGQTETVEFVFSADSFMKCSVTEIEVFG